MDSLSLKKNMLWNSAGSLTYSMCQWLITVLVARLSPDLNAAGTLALAMAVANIFQPIALYRIRSYQVSDINNDTTSGEYIGLRFVTIGLAAVIVAIYSLLTISSSGYLCIALYLVYKSADIFTDVLLGIDQKHMRMDYNGQSLGLRGILSVAAFSLLMVASGSLELSVLSMSLATYPVIILDLKRASRFESVKPEFHIHSIASLLIRCLPSVIGLFACNLVVTHARQYLSGTMGHEALGIYASVCTPVVIVQACAGYVYAPLLGSFAALIADKDGAGFKELLAKVLGALIVVFAIGILLFSVAGQMLLDLVFGHKISAYSNLMVPALISCASSACIVFLGDLLVARRRMVACCVCNLIPLAVAYLLTPCFVMLFGMNGVSFVIALAYLVGIISMFVPLLGRFENLSSEQNARQNID